MAPKTRTSHVFFLSFSFSFSQDEGFCPEPLRVPRMVSTNLRIYGSHRHCFCLWILTENGVKEQRSAFHETILQQAFMPDIGEGIWYRPFS